MSQILANESPTRLLLSFVIDYVKKNDIELEFYQAMETPIREQFSIVDRKTNKPAVVELINAIIRWENGHKYDSLEVTLNELFRIKVR